LRNWPPRDWRALLALLASIVGSTILTAFSAWLVWILWLGGWPIETAVLRVNILGKALMVALVGSLIVLTSLGLAINRRTIRADRSGFEISGGDPDPTQGAGA
jgi:hypothetical protein